MASSCVLGSVVVLRIISVLTLTASVLVMGLNNFTQLGIKVKFTDIIAFRYVFACGLAGAAYNLIQLPFALYNAAKDKRMIRNGCLQEFDFYGDKVICFLVASGVGAGFAMSCELKRGSDDLNDKGKTFLDRGLISSGLLLGGFLAMALLTIFSSNRHTSAKTRAFFQN
ncbi:CASP-like protein 4D1 [Andrographis paniculata]|uniref:CASP-like protein 4D1 n=1 Tax=Andrographis paniculata TaxID=175694 RepID=UPI0021E89ECD|nr:CASP-like protein 4D1 [Andrographis paniculata]